MRHKTRLRSISRPSGAVGQRLRRLSEWAVASCFTAAVGCSEQQVLPLQQELEAADGPWQNVVCSDLLLAADPVQPARTFDYLGVFTSGSSSNGLHMTGDIGDACKTARDRAACFSALQAKISEPAKVACAPGAFVCPSFVVTTTGDGVERYEDGAALAGLLGPIDTASEALLVAQVAGLRHACGPQSFRDIMKNGTQVQVTATGYRVKSAWDECSGTVGKQQIDVSRDGTSTALAPNDVMRSGCAIGRRPAGLQPTDAPAQCEPLAALLAECAQLEAASVPAFLRLARELELLGAPSLAERARRSARDEVRHTRQMRRLAARYGAAERKTPRVERPACARSAFDIARENAVEGCVRETFGALLAWQQATLARDPAVRQVMSQIAADETQHAELSWAIAAWLEPRLSERERAALGAERERAIEQLFAEIAEDALPSEARSQIGWPTAAQQAQLLQRMASELQLG